MVVLKTQSEFGHAPPPQTPYSIITNLPGWDIAKAVRDGDRAPLAKIVHIYPRFLPTHYVAKLGQEITAFLGIQGKGVMLYLNPAIWPYTQRHVGLEARGPHRMDAEKLEFRCVDVAGHRVYAVFFEPQNMPAVMLTWGNPGLGISIRGGEELLKGVGAMKEVAIEDSRVPEPSWTPETEAHEGVKRRINELLHHAPIDPANVKCSPDDVFLYQTGMAAIFHSSNLLLDHRPGTVVIVGIIFHNTYHHLIEECPHGVKHVGKVDEAGLNEFEAWLEDETKAGRPVSYAFVEIPGNPTLDTPDLARLKRLSEKYGFVLIVDETVSGFGNVDVFALSDFILTSLTKSFSGEANVMGGSIVLNPLSPHYASLAPLFKAKHHNELFAADAEVLLANSQGFFQRTQTLNANAYSIAEYLVHEMSNPGSPIVEVQYPPYLPSKQQYDALLRPSSPELPSPGYGCLLSVTFSSIAVATAFYDRCGFYPSPHLAGHVTLMFAYNMFVFCKKPQEREYMRGLGVKEESVRISAGLESVEDLRDTLRDALEAAKEAKKKEEEAAEQKKD